MIVSNFTNYNSGCHVVPIHDEFAVEACALAIVEIDLLSWKGSSLWYWQHLHATRGASACQMGNLWDQSMAQLWTRFSRLSKTLKMGKKAGRYLDVFNMAKKFFLIEQIFVKRKSFESESLFFKRKSSKKELLIGKCFVTKKYVLSKKTENEVLSEWIFTKGSYHKFVIRFQK